MMNAKMMTDEKLAGLHVKLMAPLIVSRMLNGHEALDDVAEYTLNDLVGEMAPDTALLCLALCGQHIAARLPRLPIAQMLGIESDHIIEAYGPSWLAHEAGEDIDDVLTQALLNAAPEYLEGLGDLLLAVLNELNDEKHAVPAILCDILGQQAHQHKEAAEERLIDLMPLPQERAAPTSVALLASAQQEGNVVIFPGLKK